MNRRRVLIRATGIGACTVAVLTASPPSGQAATTNPPAANTAPGAGTPPPPAVTIEGEGASDPTSELTKWQNDLYGPTGTLNLNYIASGGYKARQDLLAGTLDYAISGVPFTPEELSTLPKASGPLIDAPVMASGLGFLADPPVGRDGPGWGETVLLADEADPTTPNVVFRPYTGPLKVPNHNLAAMILSLVALDGEPENLYSVNSWGNPAVVSSFGLDPRRGDASAVGSVLPAEGRPRSFLRADPSESNYYSELFAATTAPEVWQGSQKIHRSTFEVGDALPPSLNTVQTKQGLPALLGVLGVPDKTGIVPYDINGTIVGVPPSGLSIFQAQFAATPARWISVQNAKGDWLTPSPAGIEAAVNAGGDTPFFALRNSVPGGYPLTYVNHLYAPSHGLSPDKTEAVATLIRYLATDGQSAMESHGDGKLSAALSNQALAAADRLVLSNCTGAGTVVVDSPLPGRFAPDLPGLKAIGSMRHCETPAKSSPGTKAPDGVVSTSVGPVSGGSFIPVASGDFSVPGGAGDATTAATASGSTASRNGAAMPGGTDKKPADAGPGGGKEAVAIASLPLSLPFLTGSSFDRFSALLLGAGFFFLGRRVVAWLIRLARA